MELEDNVEDVDIPEHPSSSEFIEEVVEPEFIRSNQERNERSFSPSYLIYLLEHNPQMMLEAQWMELIGRIY